MSRDTNQSSGLWADAWMRLKKDRLAMICLVLVTIFTLLGVYGEVVHQYHEWQDSTPSYQITNLKDCILHLLVCKTTGGTIGVFRTGERNGIAIL